MPMQHFTNTCEIVAGQYEGTIFAEWHLNSCAVINGIQVKWAGEITVQHCSLRNSATVGVLIHPTT